MLQRPNKLGNLANEIILPKKHFIYEKDKYSMFDSSLFRKNDKFGDLSKNTNIVITGVQTEWCVWNTVQELTDNGYKNIICITDATSSQDSFTHEQGVRQIERLGANVMCSDVFIKQNCDDIYKNFYIDCVLKNKKK